MKDESNSVVIGTIFEITLFFGNGVNNGHLQPCSHVITSQIFWHMAVMAVGGIGFSNSAEVVSTAEFLLFGIPRRVNLSVADTQLFCRFLPSVLDTLLVGQFFSLLVSDNIVMNNK